MYIGQRSRQNQITQAVQELQDNPNADIQEVAERKGVSVAEIERQQLAVESAEQRSWQIEPTRTQQPYLLNATIVKNTPVTPAGTILSRTVPLEDGGSITVTRSGKVTETTPAGKTLPSYQTNKSEATIFFKNVRKAEKEAELKAVSEAVARYVGSDLLRRQVYYREGIPLAARQQAYRVGAGLQNSVDFSAVPGSPNLFYEQMPLKPDVNRAVLSIASRPPPVREKNFYDRGVDKFTGLVEEIPEPVKLISLGDPGYGSVIAYKKYKEMVSPVLVKPIEQFRMYNLRTSDIAKDSGDLPKSVSRFIVAEGVGFGEEFVKSPVESIFLLKGVSAFFRYAPTYAMSTFSTLSAYNIVKQPTIERQIGAGIFEAGMWTAAPILMNFSKENLAAKALKPPKGQLTVEGKVYYNKPVVGSRVQKSVVRSKIIDDAGIALSESPGKRFNEIKVEVPGEAKVAVVKVRGKDYDEIIVVDILGQKSYSKVTRKVDQATAYFDEVSGDFIFDTKPEINIYSRSVLKTKPTGLVTVGGGEYPKVLSITSQSAYYTKGDVSLGNKVLKTYKSVDTPSVFSPIKVGKPRVVRTKQTPTEIIEFESVASGKKMVQSERVLGDVQAITETRSARQAGIKNIPISRKSKYVQVVRDNKVELKETDIFVNVPKTRLKFVRHKTEPPQDRIVLDQVEQALSKSADATYVTNQKTGAETNIYGKIRIYEGVAPSSPPKPNRLGSAKVSTPPERPDLMVAMPTPPVRSKTSIFSKVKSFFSKGQGVVEPVIPKTKSGKTSGASASAESVLDDVVVQVPIVSEIKPIRDYELPLRLSKAEYGASVPVKNVVLPVRYSFSSQANPVRVETSPVIDLRIGSVSSLFNPVSEDSRIGVAGNSEVSLRQRQVPISSQEFRNNVITRNVQTPVRSQVQVPAVREVQAQDVRVSQSLIQVTTPKGLGTPGSRNRITDFTAEVDTPPPDKFRIPQTSYITNDVKKDFFRVSVRKKGKFIPYGIFEDQGKAYKTGEFVVANTAAASFKVEKVGSGIIMPSFVGDRYKLSGRESGVVIQKRKFRISSPGEKAEISRKGLFVQKMRRNAGIFKI